MDDIASRIGSIKGKQIGGRGKLVHKMIGGRIWNQVQALGGIIINGNGKIHSVGIDCIGRNRRFPRTGGTIIQRAFRLSFQQSAFSIGPRPCRIHPIVTINNRSIGNQSRIDVVTGNLVVGRTVAGHIRQEDVRRDTFAGVRCGNHKKLIMDPTGRRGLKGMELIAL